MEEIENYLTPNPFSSTKVRKLLPVKTLRSEYLHVGFQQFSSCYTSVPLYLGRGTPLSRPLHRDTSRFFLD